MILDSLPFPAQWGILGALLGVVLYVVYAILKGNLVPRSQVRQVEQTSDMFKEAFFKQQAANDKQAELLHKLTVVADSMEKFLEAFPVDPDDQFSTDPSRVHPR